MTAESAARAHAQQFTWWRGNPEMSDEEARYHDLITLARATRDLVLEQRGLLGFYDTRAELFDDDVPPFE